METATESPTPEVRRTVCVSAPGKVLIAGGYLVLDRQYEGLVLATSSRFYCVASEFPSASTSNAQSSDSAIITITAAQFPPECSWSYRVTLRYDGSVTSGPSSSTATSASSGSSSSVEGSKTEIRLDLEQTNPDNGRNNFVEITLAKALQLALEIFAKEQEEGSGSMKEAGEELLRRLRGSKGGMEASVMADNDFYSQREQLIARILPRRFASLAQLTPFHPLPKPIQHTNKTGLGSSAALVTSLTAALLSYLGVVDIPTSFSTSSSTSSTSPTPTSKLASLDTVHALAQLSHCLAQGKIGSGFDVSSAVYGSHSYRRFSPGILSPLMLTPHISITPSGLLPALSRDKWNQTISPLRLPRGFRLLLADVDAGTDTPSFVGKVLKWRVDEPFEASQIWKRLDEANMLLKQHLHGLCEMEDKEGYDEFIAECAKVDMEHIDRMSTFGHEIYRAYSALFCIRQLFRLLTAASKVPVEPQGQTRLLDACRLLPGVVGGGVPGAGGFDALYLLVIDTPKVIENIEKVWEGWTEMSVCPLMAKQSDGGLVQGPLEDVMGLKEGIEGWRERAEAVRTG